VEFLITISAQKIQTDVVIKTGKKKKKKMMMMMMMMMMTADVVIKGRKERTQKLQGTMKP
jgi:hypothetical protein